jgi:nitroreductase
MDKPALNEYPIHDLLRNRWSPLSFSNQAVEVEDLLSLFEAARWSPSSGNGQPWSFMLATRDDADMHAQFVDVLTGNNRLWAANAPVLLMAVAKRERQPGKLNHFALYDLGQAVAHLTIQASAMGLSLRQMGGFDREKARALFAIPADHEPVTAIALGYRGGLEDLPEDLRDRERGPRTRNSLETFVFERRWGQPVNKIAV